MRTICMLIVFISKKFELFYINFFIKIAYVLINIYYFFSYAYVPVLYRASTEIGKNKVSSRLSDSFCNATPPRQARTSG
jgi:hypothetical protein